MGIELFRHPEVVKVIRAILRSKGVPSQEWEDGISEVVTEATAHVRKTGAPPETIEEAQRIVRAMAQTEGAEAGRKRKQRDPWMRPMDGDPDDHAARDDNVANLDQKRAVDVIRAAIPQQAVDVMIDIGQGVRQKDLAAEHGIRPTAMRKRVGGWRITARQAVIAAGLAAVLSLISMYLRGSRDKNVAGIDTRPPAEQAAVIRKDAERACQEHAWWRCEELLDRAKRLDAEGDATPEAQELRRTAKAGQAEAEAEGGTR